MVSPFFLTHGVEQQHVSNKLTTKVRNNCQTAALNITEVYAQPPTPQKKKFNKCNVNAMTVSRQISLPQYFRRQHSAFPQ